MCLGLDAPFLLHAVVPYQVVDGRLNAVTHDFTERRASGIAVAAAAGLDMHGDEFTRSVQCHRGPGAYSSNVSSFFATGAFLRVTYFGMPFL